MIFIASIEVAPLSDSQMASRSAIGGFVYCFVPAETQTSAKRMLRDALIEDKYILVNLEFIKEYEGFTWENQEDQIEYDRLAKRAALSNAIVYGTFYTWKKHS
ncbi:MAG: hypothetical protein ABR557_12935 [Pyrinomonadaceae bacterium]